MVSFFLGKCPPFYTPLILNTFATVYTLQLLFYNNSPFLVTFNAVEIILMFHKVFFFKVSQKELFEKHLSFDLPVTGNLKEQLYFRLQKSLTPETPSKNVYLNFLYRINFIIHFALLKKSALFNLFNLFLQLDYVNGSPCKSLWTCCYYRIGDMV